MSFLKKEAVGYRQRTLGLAFHLILVLDKDSGAILLMGTLRSMLNISLNRWCARSGQTIRFNNVELTVINSTFILNKFYMTHDLYLLIP